MRFPRFSSGMLHIFMFFILVFLPFAFAQDTYAQCTGSGITYLHDIGECQGPTFCRTFPQSYQLGYPAPYLSYCTNRNGRCERVLSHYKSSGCYYGGYRNAFCFNNPPLPDDYTTEGCSGGGGAPPGGGGGGNPDQACLNRGGTCQTDSIYLRASFH